MQETLQKLSDENQWSGWTTAGMLIGGAAWFGIAALVTFVDDDKLGPGPGRVITATAAVLIGAPMLGVGIYGLTGPTSTDEDRLVRFQKDRSAGPLSPTVLARYEGELQADAAVSRRLRISNGFASIGVAVGGATLIGFAATSPNFGDARPLAYLEGGLLALFGSVGAIAQLSGESSNEREWRLYRAWRPNEHVRRLRIGLAPAVGPHSASVSIVGEF